MTSGKGDKDREERLDGRDLKFGTNPELRPLVLSDANGAKDAVEVTCVA
jgi:hypothetical protein